jgi:glycerate-2-kinase
VKKTLKLTLAQIEEAKPNKRCQKSIATFEAKKPTRIVGLGKGTFKTFQFISI